MQNVSKNIVLHFTPNIRNNAEHERQQKQHKLRIQWEEERCQREAAKTELEKEYRSALALVSDG